MRAWHRFEIPDGWPKACKYAHIWSQFSRQKNKTYTKTETKTKRKTKVRLCQLPLLCECRILGGNISEFAQCCFKVTDQATCHSFNGSTPVAQLSYCKVAGFLIDCKIDFNVSIMSIYNPKVQLLVNTINGLIQLID